MVVAKHPIGKVATRLCLERLVFDNMVVEDWRRLDWSAEQQQMPGRQLVRAVEERCPQTVSASSVRQLQDC